MRRTIVAVFTGALLMVGATFWASPASAQGRRGGRVIVSGGFYRPFFYDPFWGPYPYYGYGYAAPYYGYGYGYGYGSGYGYEYMPGCQIFIFSKFRS